MNKGWCFPGLALLLGLWSAGCTPVGQEASEVAAAEWSVRTNAYAHGFRILERGDQRRLLVIDAQGDTLEDQRVGPEAGTLPYPLQRIVASSTTHVPYLQLLGGLDLLVGMDQAAQVRDPEVRAGVEAGRIMDLTGGDGMDRERLISLAPQVVLGSPYAAKEARSLAGVGVPVLKVAEYMEDHPLGRAEWIRYFGVLLGRERLADSLFAGIVERYRAISEVAVDTASRPVVFFGSTWKGQWFLPAGNSLMGRMIADAGGRYVLEGQRSAGNITLDTEKAIAMGANARFWGTVTAKAGTITALDVVGGDRRVMTGPAFKEGGVFAANSMETDVFGNAILEPDRLLNDLSAIFHPGAWPGYVPAYFTRTAQ